VRGGRVGVRGRARPPRGWGRCRVSFSELFFLSSSDKKKKHAMDDDALALPFLEAQLDRGACLDDLPDEVRVFVVRSWCARLPSPFLVPRAR